MHADELRDFPGRLALIALLRVGHIAGVVGVGAAVLRREVPALWSCLLLLVCGVAIALLDAYANRVYLRQVSGLVVLLKIALLALVVALAGVGPAVFWSFLVFSVIAAHAPGRIRHRRLF